MVQVTNESVMSRICPHANLLCVGFVHMKICHLEKFLHMTVVHVTNIRYEHRLVFQMIAAAVGRHVLIFGSTFLTIAILIFLSQSKKLK